LIPWGAPTFAGSGSKKAVISDKFPANFDAREAWPDCIHPVRDQGMCGSCWAFSSSGFLSDRFCIHSNGTVNVTLSPQDMVGCAFSNYGCNGGYLLNTIDHLLSEGTVEEQCSPY
jgi:cathepsin B